VQKSFAPIKIPDDVWRRSATIQFLRDRDVANLLRAAQQYAGVSQARLAAALDVSQGRLNELIHGKRAVTALAVGVRLTISRVRELASVRAF
jgi:hypothetical protein